MPSDESRNATRPLSSQEDDLDEQSPLLAPSGTDDDDRYKGLPPLEDEGAAADEDTWMGEEKENRSTWYLFLLTVGGFGLQMGWSVEMSNGSVSQM